MSTPPLEPPHHGPPPLPSPAERFQWRQFLAGAGAGCALSLIGWVIAFTTNDKRFFFIAVTIVAIKLIGIVVPLVFVKHARSVGIGVLISIPLGILIFFGTCGAVVLRSMNSHG